MRPYVLRRAMSKQNIEAFYSHARVSIRHSVGWSVGLSVGNTLASQAVFALLPLANHMRLMLSCIRQPPDLPPSPLDPHITASVQLHATEVVVYTALLKWRFEEMYK